MSLVAQELAFPAIVLPCFIALAFLLAFVLRHRKPEPGPRYRTFFLACWCTALAALVAGGMFYLQEAAGKADVSIEADMRISRGNLVELYLNDLALQPERLPVAAGVRHLYRFERLPHEITLLRLDPTEAINAEVVIYSIVVKAGDRTIRIFRPGELKSWVFNAFTREGEDAGGMVLTSTTNDPYLWSTANVFHIPGARLQAIASFVDTMDAPFVLAIAVFLLVLLVRMSTLTGRVQALLIATASCAVFPIDLLVKKLHLLPPPVKTVVGYASYKAYAKSDEMLSAALSMLFCIALGYAAAVWVKRSGEDEPAQEEGPASRRLTIWIAHLTVFGLLLLLFLPNFLGLLRSLAQVTYQDQSWDYGNSVLWAAMVNKGLRPYRDFWYPYGGLYIQLLRFPLGELWAVLHTTLVLWVLYFTLFKVTGQRLAHALMVFAVVMTPLYLGMMGGWHRYLMAIDVALFYVAVFGAERLNWKTHGPFAAFVGYAFFCEPPQVACAGAGMLVHTALSGARAFATSGPSPRYRLEAAVQVLKQRLICVGVPALTGIAAALSVYAVNGMLPGLWDFEKSIGDQSDYGSLPSEIARWVLPALQPDTVFLLMFLLAAYAVYRWVRVKDQGDLLGSALVVLSVASYFAMQKQIVRPHVMTQVRVYPYVTLAIFGLIVWRERRPAARLAITLFLGCLLGTALHRNLFQQIYQLDFEQAPRRVSDTLQAVFKDGPEAAQANATLYDRARFVGFTAQNAVIDNLTGDCGLHREDSVYVLGDDPIFYVLLNQPPPYVSNSYNDSPIYEQQKVLDWMRRKEPRFVIRASETGPEGPTFDSVPHVVRLPLIYSYVTEHYGLLRSVGRYDILARRSPGEAPDLEYWRKALGYRIDLGQIPRRARLSDYARCGNDKTRCDVVLVVRYPEPKPVSLGALTVVIQGAGEPYLVEFQVAPGEREYVVNLNRLWFWQPLAKSGMPQIIPRDGRAQSFLYYRREASPVLY